MDTNKENLRKLIEKFMDPGNTQMYFDDIEAGERILCKYPAPEPDDMLIANIKANIAMHKMPHQSTITFRKRLVEAIAVAASIAIIATISLRSFFNTPPVPPGTRIYTSALPPGWWIGEDSAHTQILNDEKDIYAQLQEMETFDDDYNALVLDEFEKRINELENRYIDIETSENNYYSSTSIIDEMENEYNEYNKNDFWHDDYSSEETLEL
jgi:hypothetical protein